MNLHGPVRQVMTPNPLHIDVGAPVTEVRRLLRERAFHHVPITSAGRLVGILSSTDLGRIALDAWVDAETAAAHLATFDLAHIMTPEPETIDPDCSVRYAAMKLSGGQFHSLPVVDSDGALVGMITSTDLLRILAQG